MTTYLIPVGATVSRNGHGAEDDWEYLKTTKRVTYTETDLVLASQWATLVGLHYRPMANRLYFRLPTYAVPYKVIGVDRHFVIVTL